MITVKFCGGLGNQMFQYAAARAVALRLDTEIVADLRWFDKHAAARRRAGLANDRPFDLPHLAIAPLRERGCLTRLLHNRLLRLGLRPFYTPETAAFCDHALTLRDGTTLAGFFQSERYFADIAADLRRAFQPRAPQLRARVLDAMAELRRLNRPLVAVHIRRGDYIRPDGGSVVVDLRRVQAAMARFEVATFVVFTDDRPWCRQALGGDNVVLSPVEGVIEDLFAMSTCEHFIIANSTFSWWAAWLGTARDKRVLAPDDWYCAGSRQTDIHRAIYAEGWERY